MQCHLEPQWTAKVVQCHAVVAVMVKSHLEWLNVLKMVVNELVRVEVVVKIDFMNFAPQEGLVDAFVRDLVAC